VSLLIFLKSRYIWWQYRPFNDVGKRHSTDESAAAGRVDGTLRQCSLWSQTAFPGECSSMSALRRTVGGCFIRDYELNLCFHLERTFRSVEISNTTVCFWPRPCENATSIGRRESCWNLASLCVSAPTRDDSRPAKPTTQAKGLRGVCLKARGRFGVFTQPRPGAIIHPSLGV
jgi:hypothetical protein